MFTWDLAAIGDVGQETASFQAADEFEAVEGHVGSRVRGRVRAVGALRRWVMDLWGRALQVERQQALQDRVVGKVGRVVFPAVGAGDGGIEGAVGVGEPGLRIVVEVGEGAFLQVALMSRLGDDPIGITWDHFGDALDPIGRVEPVLAELVEPVRGLGDGAGVVGNLGGDNRNDGAAVEGFGAVLGVGGRQTIGKGEVRFPRNFVFQG